MDKQINKTPLVRFPEFKDDWSEFRLSELMSRVSKNNMTIRNLYLLLYCLIFEPESKSTCYEFA